MLTFHEVIIQVQEIEEDIIDDQRALYEVDINSNSVFNCMASDYTIFIPQCLSKLFLCYPILESCHQFSIMNPDCEIKIKSSTDITEPSNSLFVTRKCLYKQTEYTHTN